VSPLKGAHFLNPRIQKITNDIETLRRKITDNQARLRDLERQKLELENASIIAAVRALDVPPEQFQALIAQLQAQAVPQFEPQEDVELED